jgi:hypothetical protein
LAVFRRSAFTLFFPAATLCGAAVFFADFLGVRVRFACFFVGFPFLPTVFFDWVDFFLVFFLVAIRAV